MSHYFINDDKLDHQESTYNLTLFGMNLKLTTDKGVFSRDGLDYGSKTLIEAIQIDEKTTSLLDMGCGVGVMGIVLKKQYPSLKLTMSDVNLRAVELAKKNALANKVEANILASDLFTQIEDSFDLIMSNPPIRAGKKVIYTLYADAYKHLNNEGSLWIVVRKQQGAKSTIDYLKTIYREVLVHTKDKGFYVIQAIK
ncbi:class I SAM-dependent methyltransferase [Acholeplasma equirhinis]|uniref:class I SAM-dependent methyltransferase n=1 Tax=Acholeplasma equirhinis TaxID=555393 RepID=UPI00197AE671|nr:methyltransferase [Acholeplasma equirhinis]MBN3490875.1 class I SAM-dependent methyltransferase [Acholeplasma equirhinis]